MPLPALAAIGAKAGPMFAKMLPALSKAGTATAKAGSTVGRASLKGAQVAAKQTGRAFQEYQKMCMQDPAFCQQNEQMLGQLITTGVQGAQQQALASDNPKVRMAAQLATQGTAIAKQRVMDYCPSDYCQCSCALPDGTPVDPAQVRMMKMQQVGQTAKYYGQQAMQQRQAGQVGRGQRGGGYHQQGGGTFDQIIQILSNSVTPNMTNLVIWVLTFLLAYTILNRCNKMKAKYPDPEIRKRKICCCALMITIGMSVLIQTLMFYGWLNF